VRKLFLSVTPKERCNYFAIKAQDQGSDDTLLCVTPMEKCNITIEEIVIKRQDRRKPKKIINIYLELQNIHNCVIFMCVFFSIK
jgi:hypothetical protein